MSESGEHREEQPPTEVKQECREEEKPREEKHPPATDMIASSSTTNGGGQPLLDEEGGGTVIEIASAPEGHKYVWQSSDPTTGVWVTYSKKVIDEIDRAFVAKEDSTLVTIQQGQYIIDFSHETQTNITRGTTRTIRRHLVTDDQYVGLVDLETPADVASSMTTAGGGGQASATTSDPFIVQKQDADGNPVMLNTNQMYVDSISRGDIKINMKTWVVTGEEETKEYECFVVGTTLKEAAAGPASGLRYHLWLRKIGETCIRKLDFEAGQRVLIGRRANQQHLAAEYGGQLDSGTMDTDHTSTGYDRRNMFGQQNFNAEAAAREEEERREKAAKEAEADKQAAEMKKFHEEQLMKREETSKSMMDAEETEEVLWDSDMEGDPNDYGMDEEEEEEQN